METVLPKRKSHHLQGYDYSQNGAYFITICTHQRRMLFGPNRAPVGADSISARTAALMLLSLKVIPLCLNFSVQFQFGVAFRKDKT